MGMAHNEFRNDAMPVITQGASHSAKLARCVALLGESRSIVRLGFLDIDAARLALRVPRFIVTVICGAGVVLYGLRSH